MDLGLIYDKTSCYDEDDTPCFGPRLIATILDEEYFSIYPYGYPSNSLQRACAKLIVFKNARIKDGKFLHDTPIIFYSRQRVALPSFDDCEIVNPIHCPAENTNLICTRECNPPPPAKRGSVADFYTGGNYLNVLTEEIPTIRTYCTGCDGFTQTIQQEWKSNEYGFGFSPCEFESMSDISGGGCSSVEESGTHQNKILAGYAIDPNSTWLLDEGKEVYPIVKQAIIDDDPLGAFPHTVYLHYELKTVLIKCNTGDKALGYKDKDKREKAVAVQAALGFSCQVCGLDPEKACEKLYVE